MRLLKVFLVLALFFSLGYGADFGVMPLNTAKDKPLYSSDRIVVKFAASLLRAEADGIARAFGLQRLRASRHPGAFVVYRHADPDSVIEQLRARPGVEFAEREAVRYACYTPNDSLFSYQWHMPRINADDAWDYATGAGVVVAVIDTGVLQSLQDLNNTNFVAGYDFANNDSNPTDDNGHGSHVAGTVAQSTNNGIGVAGVAYGASIMPIKVLDAGGGGWDTDIADGIYWAVNHGADVLNLSLGGYGSSAALLNAVNYAWNHGAVVVCAAGNDDTTQTMYPAGYANSISVSATDWLDGRSYYSNYGSTIDICAPGGDVYADHNNDGNADGVLQNTRDFEYGLPEGYYFWQGTSMACPHVAGVAALVKSRDMGLTNGQIRNILQTTAKNLGPAGWDNQFGHGQVDALAAVRAAGPIYGYVIAGNSWTYTNGGDDFLVYKVDHKGAKQWRKNYGGSGNDFGQMIRQTGDGGYIIGGTTTTYSNGGDDFLVYKVDSKGFKQWRKNYGGAGYEWLASVIPTSDGGYLLFGDTDSYTKGQKDFLVYKVNAAGAKQWRKNYGGSDNEDVYVSWFPVPDGLIETVDGGYAFIGSSNGYTHGSYDFLAYKVDSSGAKLWRRNLGGGSGDYGYAIQQTGDGGYIVAGYTYSYTNGAEDFLVYKLNSAGVKEWRKNYGGTSEDIAFSIKQTGDGGYVVAGRTLSYSNGDLDFLVYKLDSKGAKLWRKNYGGSGYDRGEYVIQTADGGYAIAGWSTTYSNGGSDFLVYKVDNKGAKLWRKNYGGANTEYGFCIRQTED